MNLKLTLLAAAAALALTACGGGHDAEAPPPAAAASDVPSSALATATAFSQFAGSLPKTETGQPIEVNGVVPPTSETAEPIPLT